MCGVAPVAGGGQAREVVGSGTGDAGIDEQDQVLSLQVHGMLHLELKILDQRQAAPAGAIRLPPGKPMQDLWAQPVVTATGITVAKDGQPQWACRGHLFLSYAGSPATTTTR